MSVCIPNKQHTTSINNINTSNSTSSINSTTDDDFASRIDSLNTNTNFKTKINSIKQNNLTRSQNHHTHRNLTQLRKKKEIIMSHNHSSMIL